MFLLKALCFKITPFLFTQEFLVKEQTQVGIVLVISIMFQEIMLCYTQVWGSHWSFFHFSVNDWRRHWQLDMRYADATPDDLILDMADMHPHIRLKAITTCARASEYVPPTEDGIKLDKKDTSAGSEVRKEKRWTRHRVLCSEVAKDISMHVVLRKHYIIKSFAKSGHI